ncbi:hypothetical protein [Streptomyces sp. NPDC088246]|uniref:hypothetical protein n=1 Tax=Streptomyces sp. NPDC088246 TaxID=3365842 RepID=UPI00382823A1
MYVISHAKHKALKVGVAGGKGRQTARIDQHLRDGWELHRAVLLPYRPHAEAVEKAVLNELRAVRGLGACLSSSQMPQGGWTETVSSDAIKVSDLWDLVVKFVESMPEAPPPRAVPRPRASSTEPGVGDDWPEIVQGWLVQNWVKVKQGAVDRSWLPCSSCGTEPRWTGEDRSTAGWSEGMCRYCAVDEETLKSPGRVVIMHHPGHAATLVQASPMGKQDTHISEHRAHGWRLHAGLRCRRLYDAIRIEQGLLQRLSDDGLRPFVPPNLMPQHGSDGTVDARWFAPSALWDLVNAEVSLLRFQQDRYLERHITQEDARRDMSWISRMPASADERRRRNRDDFLGPFRPDAPWWEGLPQEMRAADYETYEALRDLPRTKEEWLRREVAALGLVG